MAVSLPQDRMPEAEVSLLLALYLLNLPKSSGVAEVAIDGAQVRVGENQIFPITDFLSHSGWTQVEQRGRNDWQGFYERDRKRLEVHARPGIGDVAVTVGPKKVRAECKGGPLIRRPGGRERPILQSTLGQLLTVEHVADNDVMVAAVPHTMQFKRLADAWRHRPLVANSKIEIVLVNHNGDVDGLALLS
jgi:hypothetical protein